MTAWSDAAIPDLRGRRAIVTGGNGGIGAWTALQLAAHGADVVIAARNPRKADAAAAEIRAYVPRAQVETSVLDLADLASVRAFAERETEVHRPLDLLVNNAGVAVTPYGHTKDGFETQFGVNHLGHFALTGLLLPCLLSAAAPRVVAVSSDATRRARMRFDDLQGERHYERWPAYAQSKLANLLFVRELARRAELAGSPLIAAAAHPGLAATGLGSGFGAPKWAESLATTTLTWIADPPGRGALPTLYAATMDVPGGGYWGPGKRGEGPVPAPFPEAALDIAAAEQLWEISEELTGVRFDALTAPRRKRRRRPAADKD